MVANLQINNGRFLNDLDELAKIGALPVHDGGGRDRRAFSAAERQARDFVIRRAKEASLVVREDWAANLSISLPNANGGDQTVLFGSHLDTVPHGGPYDGALGVIAGLEVLRRVREEGITPRLPMEAIAFTDEEGRLDGLTGSRLLAGDYTAANFEHFLQQATAYPEDLAAMRKRIPGGLRKETVLEVKREPEQLAAFVELHIEQGPQLEHEGYRIGVVDAIFGRFSYFVHFYGRSDHAGTTPMHMRSDALFAAARFIDTVHMRTIVEFPGAVLTCGNVTVAPGVYNVVPNHVTVWVEFRAGRVETLTDLEDVVLAAARECADTCKVDFETERTTYLAPRQMSDVVQETVRNACSRLGYSVMQLASGALHDAHSMANITPTGMIFVPSRAGRSHCPEEDTAEEDLVAGANVLLSVVLKLAGVA